MLTQFIKLVLIGMLIGTVMFLIPFFILKVILIILLVRLIFRIAGWRRFRRHYYDDYMHRYEPISGEWPDWISNNNTRSGNNFNTRSGEIKEIRIN